MGDNGSGSPSSRATRGTTGSSGSLQSIGLGLAHQRDLEHLADGGDRNDLQARLHIVGHLGQVLLILLGDDHGGDPRPQSRQQLFLQAADRQRAAAQA